MNPRRAFAAIPVIVGIAIVGGVIFIGGKLTHSFSNLFSGGDAKAKAQVVQLTTDLQSQQAAAKAAAAARDTADSQKQLRLDVAHQNVVGAGMALKKEPNPSINVQVASILADNADKAMDPLAAEKVAEMAVLVDKLTSENAADRAAANAALAAKQSQVDQARAAESAATLQRQQAESKAADLQKSVESDRGQLAKWASDNKSLAARLGSFVTWAIVAAIVFALVFWVLPVLGQAFPPLAPVAKFVSAIFAGGLHVLHDGEKKALSAAADAAAKAKADVQAALQKEITAHEATKAALTTVAIAQPKAA